MNVNAEIPHKLKSAIAEDRLLLFVGAGISKIAGLPLWKEIVTKTLSDPAVSKGENYIKALEAEIMSPLEALDKIKGLNRREVYKHFERETSQLIQDEIYTKIARISRKIITTNYDSLLEHNTGIRAIDTSSPYNLQKIDELQEFILKIHGNHSAIDNAVIFSTDYESLYGTENGLAKFQFQKLVSSYSCLFIGFSMSDNYVINLFDKLNQMYGGVGKEHFVISPVHIDHEFVTTIKVENHSQLPEVLTQLSELRESGEEILSIEPDLHTEPELPTQGGLISTLPDDGIQLNIGSDTPPRIENWTGRVAEVNSLLSAHKVCFITGIGGQGKSALASKVLAETSKADHDFLDWRDFKEEDLNLQSKLFQLIELVSKGRVTTRQLVGLETEELVNIFFIELGQQKGVFVFDNVDKYIDLQKFTPTGDMAKFFDKALKASHTSKFIFTCRPFIQFAGIGFYQVQLEGLELSDVQELVQKYHSQISKLELERVAQRLYKATNGHPLWMGLILAQSRADINQIDLLLTRIERHHTQESEWNNNVSSIISETIFQNVWAGLKDREKILLRTLSITNISESIEDLSKIVSRKLNYNQFSKAVKSLSALNLIVAKEGTRNIELHPLVREFIKTNYGKAEQESYIALYVSYLDGFIILLKNKLGKVLGTDDIDLISKKIEILITTNKLQDAMNELRATCDSFQISGYCEEYLRLANLLLSENIWTRKKITSFHGFREFIDNFFARSAEFGNFELFDKYIDYFLQTFTAPDSDMILAKSAMCYRYWMSGDFEEAIKIGKSASDLIDVLGEADAWRGKHNYYLSLRDSKKIENVEKALAHFCETKSLAELRENEIQVSFSSKYGNVGRCLMLLGRQDEALFFTVKSYIGLSNILQSP